MIKGAIIDTTGQYRYSLWRIWDENKPKVTFIMLNGSTADANNDDPTLRRVIGYAKAWGYGSLEVVNLFGYRTTLPSELKKATEPIGDKNTDYIVKAIINTNMVIIAWGCHGKFKGRDKVVLELLNCYSVKPYYLELTKDGQPKHPLYLKSDLTPKLFTIEVLNA